MYMHVLEVVWSIEWELKFNFFIRSKFLSVSNKFISRYLSWILRLIILKALVREFWKKIEIVDFKRLNDSTQPLAKELKH